MMKVETELRFVCVRGHRHTRREAAERCDEEVEARARIRVVDRVVLPKLIWSLSLVPREAPIALDTLRRIAGTR